MASLRPDKFEPVNFTQAQFQQMVAEQLRLRFDAVEAALPNGVDDEADSSKVKAYLQKDFYETLLDMGHGITVDGNYIESLDHLEQLVHGSKVEYEPVDPVLEVQVRDAVAETERVTNEVMELRALAPSVVADSYQQVVDRAAESIMQEIRDIDNIELSLPNYRLDPTEIVQERNYAINELSRAVEDLPERSEEVDQVHRKYRFLELNNV